MQDNASIHTSNLSREWMRENLSHVLGCPARSPYLNHIENFWGVLVMALYANSRQFRTIEELKSSVLTERSGLDRNLIENLLTVFEALCASFGEAGSENRPIGFFQLNLLLRLMI